MRQPGFCPGNGVLDALRKNPVSRAETGVTDLIENGMSHELYFTSAPKGIRPGASGFCTVAATRELPGPLLEKVEALSGYRHLYSPLDQNNPIVYSHVRIEILGKAFHVLSRICAAGLDYSGRGNKFAHHVILEPDELPPGGPAWLLGQPAFMQTHWDGTVGYLPSGRRLPLGEAPPGPCHTWERLTGDAGWAGIFLRTIIGRPGQPIYCVYPPGLDLLPLITEAIALLPPERRWQISFSTYFLGIAPGIACSWRGVPDGTVEAERLRRQNPEAVFDVGRRDGFPPADPLVEQARTGRYVAVTSPGESEAAMAQEHAALPGGQAASNFAAHRFRDEGNGCRQDGDLPPAAHARPHLPPAVPPSSSFNQVADPALPPILPPRRSVAQPGGRLEWHRASLVLGALGGGSLALIMVSIFWWSHSGPDSKGTPTSSDTASRPSVDEAKAGIEASAAVANGKAADSDKILAERVAELAEMRKQREKLQDELKLIRQQNQDKEQTIQKLRESLGKLEARVGRPQEEPKKPPTNVGGSAPPPAAALVDGLLPIDPNQERNEAIKLEPKSLPPQTNLSLLCQKQLGRPIRFEGQQKRETKGNERWPVLDITVNGPSEDLGQFRVVEGQLTFSWTEREKNKPLRRTFLDSCLLVLEMEKLGKKVFALAGPAVETRLKLADEQGVFTLRPERLAGWHGPDLFLNGGEFADRTPLRHSAGENPRMLESEDYTILLRQGPSSLIEIWPRRKAVEKPLLRKLVVYTTIKDYRVDVYRLDVSK
jgi:hypothetical protein